MIGSDHPTPPPPTPPIKRLGNTIYKQCDASHHLRALYEQCSTIPIKANRITDKYYFMIENISKTVKLNPLNILTNWII